MQKFKGTVYTYVDIWNACGDFLEVVEQEESGSLKYHACMAVMVFSAFCLEAYLNHIGPIYVRTWKNKKEEGGEIWLSPKDKIKTIASKLNFKLDFGQGQFQTFIEIFEYRKLAAHAETISMEGEFTGEAPDLETELQIKANPEQARKFYQVTGEIIRYIHSHHIPDEEPLFIVGEAGWMG